MISADTAIVVFAYNRPTHVTRLFESLLKNPTVHNYHVIVFQDGPRDLQDRAGVEETLSTINSFLTDFTSFELHRNTENNGLANSIIRGVSHAFTRFDKCIILEDDIVVSSGFLSYMQENLDFHENNQDIGSVTGYKLVASLCRNKSNLYLSRRHSSWGWGTWKRTWNSINWEILVDFNIERNRKVLSLGGDDLAGMVALQKKKAIDSWSIIFDVNMLLRGLFCVYPIQAFCINAGMDGSGTHYNSEAPIKKHGESLTFGGISFSIRVPKLSRLYNLQVKMKYSKFRFTHVSILIGIRHLLWRVLLLKKKNGKRLQ